MQLHAPSRAARVRWVDSDAANLALEPARPRHHDRPCFQVFLADDDVRATLRALRRHLPPGGRLAFETRNPLVEEWRTWTSSRETLQVPGIGAVEMHYNVTSTDPAFVTFETHFRFAPDDHRGRDHHAALHEPRPARRFPR